MRLKNSLGLVLALGMGSAFAAPLTFQLKDLPDDRSSMEYGAQINAFTSKVVGHKWATDEGMGFEFHESVNPFRNRPNTPRFYTDAYMFSIHRFMWRSEQMNYGDSLVARESRRVGFIEFTDGNPVHLNFRLIDDKTLEYVVYEDADKTKYQFILKRVDEFPENPKPVHLKSASESGMIY